jgi:hypothetical protein
MRGGRVQGWSACGAPGGDSLTLNALSAPDDDVTATAVRPPTLPPPALASRF